MFSVLWSEWLSFLCAYMYMYKCCHSYREECATNPRLVQCIDEGMHV